MPGELYLKVAVHRFPALKCADLKIPKAATQARNAACKPFRGNGEIGPDWWVFTFVRHPLDRLVSLYANQYRRRYRGRSLGFADFAEDVVSGRLGRNRHWVPQVELFDAVPKVDFVGKFERLEEDWDYIRSRYPFGPLKVIKRQQPQAVAGTLR